MQNGSFWVLSIFNRNDSVKAWLLMGNSLRKQKDVSLFPFSKQNGAAKKTAQHAVHCSNVSTREKEVSSWLDSSISGDVDATLSDCSISRMCGSLFSRLFERPLLTSQYFV